MEVKYDPILGQLREADASSSSPVVTKDLTIVNETTVWRKVKFVATATGLDVIITLTELGFDGTESQDAGATGDWVTVLSF